MEQTLSQKLKATRESRGLSLADAAHATRIPIPRLQQLESANYAAFGNMAYARSFIRLYSRYLGVNADTVISELPEPILGGSADYRYLTETFGPWVPSGRDRRPGPMQIAKKGTSRAVPALVMFTMLCVATFSVLKAGLLSPQSRPSVAESQVIPVNSRSMTTSLEPGVQVTRAEIPGLPSAGHVTISKAIPVQAN